MSLAAAGVPIQFSASTDVNNFFIPVSEGITLPSLSSNFPLTAFKIKTVPQKSFLFNVTGSISGFNAESSGATSLSGSVQLIKRSGTDTILEEGVFIKQAAEAIEGGSGQFNFSTTSSLAFNDLVYLKVVGLKNGTSTIANPSAFTASLHSFRITSEPTGSAKELVIEPFLTSPFYGTDCDVLYGNASQPVSNPFLQDIDYGDGTIIPVNNAAIISGSATRGTVPESYYTSLPSINSKYNGAKNQTEKINLYTEPQDETDFFQPFNIGTYGQTPSITLNQSLVAYIEWIGGTTPELNDKVAANIKYLINENGDAVSPNLSPITVRDVQMNFSEGDEIEVSLIDPPIGTGMQVLNGNKTVIKGGYRVEPILYTQIPTSPFSSSFFFDTSSLLPVDNVTFTAINSNIGTAQTITSGNSATIEFPLELSDSGSVYNPTTDTYTINQFTIDSGVDVELRASIRVTTDGPPSAFTGNNGYYTVFISNETYPGLISNSSTYNEPIIGTRVHNLYVKIKNEDLVLGQTFKVFFNATNHTGNGQFTIGKGGTNPGGASEPSSNFYASQVPAPNGNVEIELNNNPLWAFSGSSNNVLLGRTGNFSEMYDFLQQRTIEGSGFNPVQNIWKILPGDQFRFQNDESKVYNVINVVDPNSNDLGQIIITLDRGVSAAINKDYFLIRRYVEDGSFIIFDQSKPGGASGNAFIRPRFTTEALNKDIDQFIQDLKSKNLLT